MPAPIRTERLHLLPFAPGDAGLLVDLDADPEVVKYVHLGPFTPPPADRYEAEVLPKFLPHPADGPALGCRRVHPDAAGEPGPFAGWAMLRPVGRAGWFAAAPDLNLDPATPELGYRLARRFWGNGYATEASRAVLAGLPAGASAVAIRQADNAGSGRVMEKCGFRLARTFQLPGVPRPTALHVRDPA